MSTDISFMFAEGFGTNEVKFLINNDGEPIEMAKHFF